MLLAFFIPEWLKPIRLLTLDRTDWFWWIFPLRKHATPRGHCSGRAASAAAASVTGRFVT
jgi:hypothetical protein